MPKRYASLAERIAANSVPANPETHPELQFNGIPCRIWLRKTDRKGYPMLSMRMKSGPRKGKPRNFAVHRLVIKVIKGRIMRRGYVGKHLCNCKRCVEPEHLAGDTQKSNVKQCIEDGRHRTPFAATDAENHVSNPVAAFTDEDMAYFDQACK